MKISEILLEKSLDGLTPFHISALENVVVVTGSNGSGKTRLLKLIERYVHSLQYPNEKGEKIPLQLKVAFPATEDSTDSEEFLTHENASKLEIVNYSHFDAQLQLPKHITPYVIHKAKDLLKVCSYEETALNSLLLLEDMAQGYSEQFQNPEVFRNFSKEVAATFNLEIEKDESTGKLLLFGLDPEKAALSPGQQYLLRIAVACYCNQNNNKAIFLMDEPELHLHPKALVELIKSLRTKFVNSQFWISTHSLALVSYLSVTVQNSTVIYLSKGKPDILRSNSSKLLDGLIGSEENLFAMQQLMAFPDEYACNKFAVECLQAPKTLAATGNDLQTELVKRVLKTGDSVVDFGAGKGRFFEELALSRDNSIADKIHYFAYDPSSKDSDQCKTIMNHYGSTSENYFNDISKLKEKVDGADYVLLVNVLHEIEPASWPSLFSDIKNLLNKAGHLLIVEREELTVGESAFDNGFLVISENGAKALFGDENCLFVRHPDKSYIVMHIIERKGLDISKESIEHCIQVIREEALSQIKDLRCNVDEFSSNKKRFRAGIKLAFLLSQYANASLIMETLNDNLPIL